VAAAAINPLQMINMTPIAFEILLEGPTNIQNLTILD